MLVIDRSHLKGGGTTRLPITDPDPEKWCATMRQIAKTLKPPEACWYVEPAKPHRLWKTRNSKTE